MGEARREAAADRIGHDCEHDRNCPRLAGERAGHGRRLTDDCIGPQLDQLSCKSADPIRITSAPAQFDPEIAAFRPSELRKRASKRRDLRLRSRIALRKRHQHADQPDPVRLLRAHSEWPSDCRAPQKRYKFAPFELTN